MTTGVKPRDTLTSTPTNPLRVPSNRVVSPTLGGAGNHRPTSELDPFVNGTGRVKSTKVSTPVIV